MSYLTAKPWRPGDGAGKSASLSSSYNDSASRSNEMWNETTSSRSTSGWLLELLDDEDREVRVLIAGTLDEDDTEGEP
jgi:hypothetical protein